MDKDGIIDFDQVIEEIRRKDGRYQREAFHFVREALDYRVSLLEERRHISGKELVEGVGALALDRFGPMARTVLNHWGIGRSEDVGNIVFHLVDVGIMTKTEEDSPEDFSNVLRFDEAFEEDYRW